VSGPQATHTSGRPRRRSAPVVRRVVLSLVFLVVLGCGWLAWRGWQARSELVAAQDAVERVRAAAAAGDSTAIDRELASATEHADRASALTSDPVWRFAGWVPVLGRTPLAVSQTASAVDALVVQVLPDLAAAAKGLDPHRLRHGGRIDVAAIAAAAPLVQRADARLAVVQSDLDHVDLSLVLPQVRTGVDELRSVVADTRATVHDGSTAAGLLPAMLGASGVRRYLVTLQNNAEARGTGGLVGAFAVVEVSNGRPVLVRLGSDSELRSATTLPVDLGPAFRHLYGNDPALWANTNLSAHFPYAARLQLALWKRQFDQPLDGVVAVDPVAFGYLLGVTGPIAVPGVGTVDGDRFAEVAMRDVYARFPAAGQEPDRTAYLQALARSALDRVLGSSGDARALAKALGRAASERRLLVYSSHPGEESLLAGTALGGVVDDRVGPYAALVVDNEAGNKLDYYLDRSLDYVAAGCDGGASTVTVTVRNTAPATGLPAYAAYRQDRGPTSTVAGRGGDGSTRVRLVVYAAEGAELGEATLDGDALAMSIGSDGAGAGRPVFATSVELQAGQQRTLVLSLSEPHSSAAARAWVGPLVRASKATVQAPTCR